MITGSGWNYDPQTDQWYWHQFLPFQPDLNYWNPEVKQAMFDIVRFWLQKGVDVFVWILLMQYMKMPSSVKIRLNFICSPRMTIRITSFEVP